MRINQVRKKMVEILTIFYTVIVFMRQVLITYLGVLKDYNHLNLNLNHSLIIQVYRKYSREIQLLYYLENIVENLLQMSTIHLLLEESMEAMNVIWIYLKRLYWIKLKKKAVVLIRPEEDPLGIYQ